MIDIFFYYEYNTIAKKCQQITLKSANIEKKASFNVDFQSDIASATINAALFSGNKKSLRNYSDRLPSAIILYHHSQSG